MAVLRTSETTHKSLKELALQTGLPMQTVLDHAVASYRRTRLATRTGTVSAATLGAVEERMRILLNL